MGILGKLPPNLLYFFFDQEIRSSAQERGWVAEAGLGPEISGKALELSADGN